MSWLTLEMLLAEGASCRTGELGEELWFSNENLPSEDGPVEERVALGSGSVKPESVHGVCAEPVLAIPQADGARGSGFGEQALYLPSMRSVVASNVPRAITARGGTSAIKNTNGTIYLK